MEKMKIVFVIPNMAGGGTERVISLLAREYASRNIEVDILTFAGDACAYQLDKKVKLICVSSQSHGNPLIQIKRLWKMRKYFRKNRGCFIYSFSVAGTIFSAITTLGLPCPIFVSERNDPRQGRQDRLRDWAYSRAVCIATQTQECISYFPSKLRNKMTVIPNPIDDTLPEAYIGEREKTVVYVGRLHHQKNPKLLLAAFAEFVKKHPEYSLHMYGDGEMKEEMEEYARSQEIEDQVVWHGFCADVRKRIYKAGMYVLSSDFEGISNSMTEALAMGIPVIATNCPIGGSAMYIEDGVSGILIPVGDKERLVSAMCAIAEDEKFAQTLSRNAAKIREKYPISKIADQMLLCAKGEKTAVF